jgi:hypothetical protein
MEKPLTTVPRRPPQAAQAGAVNPAGLPAQQFVSAPYPQPPAAPIEGKTVIPQSRVSTSPAARVAAANHLHPVADLGQMRQHANEISQRGADLPANRQEIK